MVQPTWTMEVFVESIQRIRSEVGSNWWCADFPAELICCCSIRHQAVGSQLTRIFVDHGFMRKYEARRWRWFSAGGLGKAIAVDAKERFFAQVRRNRSRGEVK